MTIDSKLIERIEGAAEGSREMDLEIAVALGQCQLRGGFAYAWSRAGSTNELYTPPLYTSSIDAAMTLVPEGHCWTVAVYWCDGEDKPPYFADCGDLEAIKAGDFQTPIHEAWAQSPALALCAAALRSRSSS